MWWMAAALAAPIGSPIDGWTVEVPATWRLLSQEEGSWALVSDTEPGLVLVTYTHGASWEDLRREAGAPLADQGTALAVMGAPTERTVGVVKAVTAEYQGTAADGSALAARAIGLAGPTGGLLVVGFASPLHLPAVVKRVEGLAVSVKWGRPDPGNVAALKGTWCNVDAPAARMVFDGAGALAAPAGGRAASYGIDGDLVLVRFPDHAERRCRQRAAATGVDLECSGARWTTAACR